MKPTIKVGPKILKELRASPGKKPTTLKVTWWKIPGRIVRINTCAGKECQRRD
jgi:hypothetical protein